MKPTSSAGIALIAGLILAAIFLTGCAPAGETPEQMIAAARAVDDSFAEAYNNGDVDAVMNCYWNNPEVILFDPGGMQNKGWDNIKASMAETFANAPGGKFEFAERNEKVAGDMVIGWGLWAFTMNIPDGSTFKMEGRYTDVKAKRDGKWVYIIDHASVPLPPPPTGM